MGNKPAKSKKKPEDSTDGVRPSGRGSKKGRPDKERNASLPDLGGAVPYRSQEEDPKVTVTIYRSVRDIRRHPSEIQPQRNDVNVRIYRKSTSGEPEKPSTLPRNFMRSKSATLPGGRAALTPGESHYQEFPSLRRRIDSASTKGGASTLRSSRTSMEKPNHFFSK